MSAIAGLSWVSLVIHRLHSPAEDASNSCVASPAKSVKVALSDSAWLTSMCVISEMRIWLKVNDS